MEKKTETEIQLTIICAWCKKIVVYGNNLVRDFALGNISHGICKKCKKELLSKKGEEKS